MLSLVKPFVVSLVSLVTFALGAAPAAATTNFDQVFAASSPTVAVQTHSQSLSTVVGDAASLPPISSVLAATEIAGISHNFDVEATIAAALSEVGTSRATGWGQQGECIVSVQRWIRAGGGAWTGGGDPVANYVGATRLTLAEALPGDVIQYEFIASPTSWVSGIHTVLITGVNDDGTFSIVESNNPGGSGLVQADSSWVPAPPAGFQAVVWRF